MPTKRQRIVSKFLEAAQAISIDNEFETNIGENVLDWQTDFQEDELPGTSVCDLTAEKIEDLSNEYLDFFNLPVQIRTTLKSGTRAEDARKIEGDILKALKKLAFENDNGTERLSGEIYDGTEKLAGDVNVKRSGFVLAEDAFAIVAIAVEIELTFYTKRFNAYE